MTPEYIQFIEGFFADPNPPERRELKKHDVSYQGNMFFYRTTPLGRVVTGKDGKKYLLTLLGSRCAWAHFTAGIHLFELWDRSPFPVIQGWFSVDGSDNYKWESSKASQVTQRGFVVKKDFEETFSRNSVSQGLLHIYTENIELYNKHIDDIPAAELDTLRSLRTLLLNTPAFNAFKKAARETTLSRGEFLDKALEDITQERLLSKTN